MTKYTEADVSFFEKYCQRARAQARAMLADENECEEIKQAAAKFLRDESDLMNPNKEDLETMRQIVAREDAKRSVMEVIEDPTYCDRVFKDHDPIIKLEELIGHLRVLNSEGLVGFGSKQVREDVRGQVAREQPLTIKELGDGTGQL